MGKGKYIYIAADANRNVLVPNLCEHVLIASWKLKAGLEMIYSDEVTCRDVLYYEYCLNDEQALLKIIALQGLDNASLMEIVKKQNPELKDLYYVMWSNG